MDVSRATAEPNLAIADFGLSCFKGKKAKKTLKSEAFKKNIRTEFKRRRHNAGNVHADNVEVNREDTGKDVDVVKLFQEERTGWKGVGTKNYCAPEIVSFDQ